MKAKPKWEIPKYIRKKWKEGPRHLFYTGFGTRDYLVGVGKTKAEALVNYVINYHIADYAKRLEAGRYALSRQGPRDGL